jgi:NDP-sugar pyrophosphorylase family protein
MIDYRISKGAIVARGIIPGAFTVIREYADIATGAQIGAGCYIAPYVTVGEGADIGRTPLSLQTCPRARWCLRAWCGMERVQRARTT